MFNAFHKNRVHTILQHLQHVAAVQHPFTGRVGYSYLMQHIMIYSVGRVGRGYSFAVLRAKILSGQQFLRQTKKRTLTLADCNTVPGFSTSQP